MTHSPVADETTRSSSFDDLFEQWRREASKSPPDVDDFAEMLAHIRANAAFDRDVYSKSHPQDELTAVLGCLWAVLTFLQKQRWLMEGGDLAPLLRLNGALNDLAVGNSSHLFETKKKAGRPGVGSRQELLHVMAARALDELVAAGERKGDAARRVARALKAGRRDMDRVKAATVVNWRDRLKQGPGGAGASEQAVRQFRAPLNGFPTDPKLRGEMLLKALATRGGAIG